MPVKTSLQASRVRPAARPVRPVRAEDKPRSRGAVLLARTGLTADEISTRLGVAPSLVRFWRLGNRVPALDKRRSLAREFDIPPEAWDTPAGLAAVPREIKRITEAEIDRAAVQLFGVAIFLAEQVRECESIEAMAKVASGASSYLEKSARLAGVSLDVNTARLQRTPAWRRLHDVIVRSLQPYPEAAQALARALDDHFGQGG